MEHELKSLRILLVWDYRNDASTGLYATAVYEVTTASGWVLYDHHSHGAAWLWAKDYETRHGRGLVAVVCRGGGK